MKIKKEFWIPITKKNKTIELRKINKLYKLISLDSDYSQEDVTVLKNGRIKIDLYDEEEKTIWDGLTDECEYIHEFLGTITINGYSIIPNVFNMAENAIDFFQNKTINDICFDKFKNNGKWLKENFDWLKKYFKNKSEILVLNIESWEGKNHEIKKN